MTSVDFFVAGGTLPYTAPSYVQRPADSLLLQLIETGELCYVLNTRQMGKSSLLMRTIYQLQKQNKTVKPVFVDLTTIGSAETAEKWYYSFVSELAYHLDLDIDLSQWWEQNQQITFTNRFIRFLREIALPQTDGLIAIFIDEIDSVIQFDFSDDFLTAIRAIYNGRRKILEFSRLSFVLVGTAAPHELIKEKTRTPFNVGTRIKLDEFHFEDAKILVGGLPQPGQAILERVFYWTSGHPYLTQKICQAIARGERKVWTDEAVDALVEELFLTERALVEEVNLQFVRDRVLSSANREQLLRLYQRIYLQQSAIKNDEQSIVHSELKLAGLVRVDEQGYLAVRNHIYRQAFNEAWIREHQTLNWRKVALAVSLLSAIILAILGYRIWQTPPADEVLADTYVSGFVSTDNPTLRLNYLASLYALPGYTSPANDLFADLGQDEQVALFQNVTPDLQPMAYTVITYTYQTLYTTRLDGSADSTPLLSAMQSSLSKASEPTHNILAAELEQWVNGRQYAQAGDKERSMESYTAAITLNPTNAATHLERAIVGVTDNLFYQQSLQDLTTAVQLEPALEVVVTSLLVNTPAIHGYLADAAIDFPALVAMVPPPIATATMTPMGTATNTPTATPTATLTATPTAIPSPLGCGHPHVATYVFPQLSGENAFYGQLDAHFTCEVVADDPYTPPRAIHIVYEDQNDPDKFGYFGIGPLDGFDASVFTQLCVQAKSSTAGTAFWLNMKDIDNREGRVAVAIEAADVWEAHCVAVAAYVAKGIDTSQLDNINVGFDTLLGSVQLQLDEFRLK